MNLRDELKKEFPISRFKCPFKIKAYSGAFLCGAPPGSNVSANEVFDLFKESAADEVIFVLPKRSKAFGQAEHFKLVGAEAKRSGKAVSLLSENPQVGLAAQEEGFAILSGPARKPHAPRVRTKHH